MTWPMIPVSELCELAVDCVNKTAPTVEHETEFKMIRTTNVKGGFIDLKEVRFVTEEVFNKWTRRSRPQYGDVVLTREAPVGEVGRFTSNDEKVFLGQRLFHYRPDPNKLDWNFLAYALQSPQIQGKFKGMGFGATVDHVRVGDAERLPIPCPPLNVQKRIGDTLSAYDDLIENNRRRIQLLEQAARLLYKEWFVHLRFPGHEHTQIIDGVPEGWPRRELSDLTSKIGSGATPRGGAAAYQATGITLVRSQNIYDFQFVDNGLAYIDDLQAKKLANVTVEERDILLNITGASVGRCCMIPNRHLPARVNQHVMIIRVKPSRCGPHYILHSINSHRNKEQLLNIARAGGATREALTKDIVGRLSVIIPLASLLNEFEQRATVLSDQCHLLDAQNVQLAKARDLLLPKLMNGEVAA